MELLAAFAEHAATPDRRLGPPALRRRRCARRAASRGPGKFAGADQARPGENAALLAPLLDIPLPPERALALPPEELRRRQLAALTNWVMAGARAQPAVLAFEDLQWADPTTLDLLRGIAERGALAPLFVLVTARPEFRPPWGMRSHHSTISLAPLDRAAGAAHGRRTCRPPRAAEGSDRWRDRAHRRRAAICRGSDAALAGARRAGRHPGDPADTATIVDGAA